VTDKTENGFELSVTCHIAAPPETVWQIITERLTEFWCPKPWRSEIVEVDWRSGGRMAVNMTGPNPGETSFQDGVFLEVVPGSRFVFTDAFQAGWVPTKAFMAGIFEISPDRGGTHYRAAARHWNEEDCKRHEAMGFADGWGAVMAQLKALAEG
jgi:uncharacterized protein YndB with AHSA1/START domain